MKKVVFLVPTLSHGGGERVVSELSLSLTNIEPVIVLFKNQVSYPYRGRLISLDLPLSNNFLSRIYYFFVAIKRFRKVIKKERPDFTVSFSVPANIINVLSSKKAILRVDTFLSNSKNKYIFLIKLLFNRAYKVICVSKSNAKDLVDNFSVNRDKVRTIYNPLDVDNIKRLSLEPIGDEYKDIFLKDVIINTGRLTEEKNQLDLVKAFIPVKSANLVIMGVGKLEDELKRFIEDNKLSDRVFLLGWQENPFKFLSRAKIFVSSSRREGLPYSILEAMACGLPIISTDCKSGPREILAPTTNILSSAKEIEYQEFGLLLPVGDIALLSGAMIKLLNDSNLREKLSLKSKQRADDFKTEKVVKGWDFLS